MAARAVGSLGGDSQFVADRSMDDEIQSDASLRFRACECLAQLRGELRVVGLPELLARLQLGEINRTRAEGKFDVATAAGCDFVDAAALFLAFLTVAGEYDAIACGHGAPGRDDD